MASSNPSLEKFLAPKEQPVALLDAKNAFSKLTPEEKKYAHYISQASWHGSRICFTQTSVESPILFEIFQKLFSSTSLAELEKSTVNNKVSAEDFKNFVQFAAAFYGNMGNYLSFGDTKIIPRVPQDKFQAILESANNNNQLTSLFNQIKDQLYENQKSLTLGMSDKEGVSSYYSSDVTSKDVAVVREFMQSKGISPYNTRLWKHTDSNNKVTYEIKTASGEKLPSTTHEHNGTTITISYGDHSEHMKLVAENMEKAKEFASNDNQRKMLEAYVATFSKGSIDDHKNAQRYWIKDIGPVVEHNIGFIESYRDPEGERGEFEGFVSMVNKEQSKRLATLVDNAERFLKELPWSKDFEKDKFLRPDFTSLDVLTFASSGVPAGINIPNYDDIRQSEGFKNVSLGNVLSAKAKEPADWVLEKDQKMYDELESTAFEVQVGIHELLGHGSGKLLMEDKDGKLNFDKNLVNPFTGKPVESWYKPGETWDNKFQSMASTLEECRAECTGIYLCTDKNLLSVFGHNDSNEADNVMYVNWLQMCRAGLRALEFYTPELKKWGQAHMQGRYAILQVLLKHGDGVVKIDQTKDNAFVILDQSKILTNGKKAIGEFLHKLQIFKSTADVEGATKFYNEYVHVPEDLLPLRNIVLSKKKPRRVFVQAHTFIDSNGEVQYQEFEPTPEGLIKSFVTRFGTK